MSGPVFTAVVSATAVSAAQDVFAVKSPDASSRIRVREIRLGQYTDFGDAAAEILSVQVIRGHRTAGNQTTTVTPRNVWGWADGAASPGQADTGTTVAINDTGVATDTGSGAQVIVSDAWNIAVPWLYQPPHLEQIVLDVGQRMVVRITAPADAITMNATIVYEKIGLGNYF